MEYLWQGNIALGDPLNCSNADIPAEIKEIVEDEAAEVVSVCCCKIIGASLGFTAQVGTAW